MPSPVRIATFNIHNAYGDERRAVAGLIAEGDPDIIALQECTQSSVDAVCGHLGLGWRACIAPGAWNFSNAVLSRFPLERVANLALRTAQGETRSASIARITLPSGRIIHVCSTHLDHLDEDTRLAQWALLHERLPADSVVCGDFNALRRADYSAEAWAQIEAVRERNGWEAPVSALTERLEQQGYRDAARLAGGALDGATCRFKTRIDYIWLASGFSGECASGSYQRLPAIERQVSDHDLVMVDLLVD